MAANLLPDPVIRLCGSVAGCIDPAGVFISSGILSEKEDKVTEALENNGFKIMEIMRDGIWSAIAAGLR